MRKLASVALLITAVSLIPAFAFAENFYVAIRGGPGWTQDNQSGRKGFEDADSFKLGFTGGAGVGYLLPFGLRVEGEFGYMYVPLDKEGGVSVDGSVKTYLLMANIYYDLKLPALGGFKPYVGFGIGGARENRDQEFLTRGLKFEAENWRTAFAYQARVGVGYDVNRWLDVMAGYRYIHVDGSTQRLGPTEVRFDSMNNHSAEFGFAIKF